MPRTMNRPVLIASMLGFIAGIITAATLGMGVAERLTAAPGAQVRCGVADGFSLGGTWSSGGRLDSVSAAKIDASASFEVENEYGSTAKAGVYCNRLVITERLRDGSEGNRWDVGLEAELISEDDGLTITRINWANGTFWSRFR